VVGMTIARPGTSSSTLQARWDLSTLKPHSEEQDHSNLERVARADAEHPVPRAHLDKGKALAAKRKTPLECHRELGPDVQKELPLRAVQNSFAKLRQKKQMMSVSEFADYLQSRKLDVNSCDSIPDGLWVLWYEVRTDYCAVMFFITELVRLVLDACQKSAASLSPFRCQSDFTGNIVHSGLKLGILGCPVFHRSKRNERWRRFLAPTMFVWCPYEDSEHCVPVRGFVFMKQLLCSLLTSPPPVPFYAQLNSDWSGAMQKAHREALSDAPLLLHDLEHLYKNLDRRNDVDSVEAVKKLFRLMPFLPMPMLQMLFGKQA
jgi:hypothetical protein